MNPAHSYVESTREGILIWLESVRCKDSPWGRWKYNAHMERPYALISSSWAIQLLDRLGELDQLPVESKQEAITYLQSEQDPSDGFFKDSLVTEADRVPDAIHSWEDIWGQMGAATTALKALGAAPLHPMPSAHFLDFEKADFEEEFLCWNWAHPWHVGERLYRAVAARFEKTGDPADPAIERLFAIYESEIHDPHSGWPTKRGCQDESVAVAGLFKVMHAYQVVGREVPDAERGIDSTLALQHADGEFGMRRNMCINWDALWVLRELDLALGGGHRHAEIVEAGNTTASLLMDFYRKPDGGFAFLGDRCWAVHHSIRLCDREYPESDIVGTVMCHSCLQYADEWNDSL